MWYFWCWIRAENVNFMGGRIKSDAKYRRERNPLFSLAPPRFCAPAQRFRKREYTRECEFACLWQVDHRGVRKYRARIVRTTGNATCIHDCIARVSLISRLHAVCLSVTSVSLRLQGHSVLFMVYQLPRSIVRFGRILLGGAHARLINL